MQPACATRTDARLAHAVLNRHAHQHGPCDPCLRYQSRCLRLSHPRLPLQPRDMHFLFDDTLCSCPCVTCTCSAQSTHDRRAHGHGHAISASVGTAAACASCTFASRTHPGRCIYRARHKDALSDVRSCITTKQLHAPASATAQVPDALASCRLLETCSAVQCSAVQCSAVQCMFPDKM